MFETLTNSLTSLFSGITGKGTLTLKDIDATLAKIKEALLESDVPLELADTFCQEISREVVGKKVLASLKPAEHLLKVVHDRLQFFLGAQEGASYSFDIPSVIMVMGLQGSGKTTTVAKIAHCMAKEAQSKGKERSILLASVDFYRPAAVEQLAILAEKAGIPFYKAQACKPLAAAQEIYAEFKKRGAQYLFLDTAGRLHIDTALLEELKQISIAVKPRYKLLVLDAMTGQESLTVARAFNDSLGFDGAILSKVDSDTRGGAAFSFRYALKKPILFAGTGEKLTDIERFNPERVAGRLLGMGDLATLAEKAEQKIKQSDQQHMANALKKDQLSLNDFAKQIDMMAKLGSLSQIAGYMPGMNKASLLPDALEKGEQELKRFRAILSSMTEKERLNHRILDASRKKRIAQGAGVQVTAVHLLLERFEQSQQYVKLLKKFGRLPGLF